MINFKRTMGENVKLSVHVDRTPESYAYHNIFSENGGKTLEKYTRIEGGKRPSAKELVKETLEKAGGSDHIFYICGPENWMNQVQKELLEAGAKKVMCEVF